MKAATAKLLRAVIRLVEDDVRELADTVVEIDEREAAHHAAMAERVIALENRLHAHVSVSTERLRLIDEQHSRKVEP